MGADGPGKAEIAVDEIVRTHVFCDDWEQASHNGELAHAVDAVRCSREAVTELGAVLTGEAVGRRSPDDITIFDRPGSRSRISRSHWRLWSEPPSSTCPRSTSRAGCLRRREIAAMLKPARLR